MRYGNARRINRTKMNPEMKANASDAVRGAHARVGLEMAVTRAERAMEFRAQHGKVRVLFANGKPVPPEEKES